METEPQVGKMIKQDKTRHLCYYHIL